ncbi:uncharacterized protein LOC123551252 isoform X2 [Mercenaria mercenaria]|nr:uncharacterized protein LOC123551252 isoform X2 [Mercenaria mercenaria]XP_053396730.1 uncharacterized protein LOC123551252 isoform X2 [Mercenaria mercenaria]
MKCIGNNRWAETGTPVCLADSYMYEFALKKIHEETANSCSLPTKLANGYIKPKPNKDGRFHIGTRVTFSCKEGYTLKGAHTMVCKGNDTWTEDENIFCLKDGYIDTKTELELQNKKGWYNVGVGLVAICATLFIVVVLSFVILWQHHQRIGLVKQKKETSRKNSVSSAESGTDVNENDEDETSPMMNNGHVTVIDEKDRDSNSSINGKEASNPDRPVDVIPSPPPPTDCNPESNPSGVTNHNTNCTYNIICGNITNQTDKVENNDDKNDYKPDRKPEEEHVTEKTPTEESQTTVVALQETEDGTCKTSN